MSDLDPEPKGPQEDEMADSLMKKEDPESSSG